MKYLFRQYETLYAALGSVHTECTFPVHCYTFPLFLCKDVDVFYVSFAASHAWQHFKKHISRSYFRFICLLSAKTCSVWISPWSVKQLLQDMQWCLFVGIVLTFSLVLDRLTSSFQTSCSASSRLWFKLWTVCCSSFLSRLIRSISAGVNFWFSRMCCSLILSCFRPSNCTSVQKTGTFTNWIQPLYCYWHMWCYNEMLITELRQHTMCKVNKACVAAFCNLSYQQPRAPQTVQQLFSPVQFYGPPEYNDSPAASADQPVIWASRSSSLLNDPVNKHTALILISFFFYFVLAWISRWHRPIDP